MDKKSIAADQKADIWQCYHKKELEILVLPLFTHDECIHFKIIYWDWNYVIFCFCKNETDMPTLQTWYSYPLRLLNIKEMIIASWSFIYCNEKLRLYLFYSAQILFCMCILFSFQFVKKKNQIICHWFILTALYFLYCIHVYI